VSFSPLDADGVGWALRASRVYHLHVLRRRNGHARCPRGQNRSQHQCELSFLGKRFCPPYALDDRASDPSAVIAGLDPAIHPSS
jgi:hypothetical protein